MVKIKKLTYVIAQRVSVLYHLNKMSNNLLIFKLGFQVHNYKDKYLERLKIKSFYAVKIIEKDTWVNVTFSVIIRFLKFILCFKIVIF